MADELKLNGYTTGVTVYGVVENAAGQVWNTSTTAFETYTTANIASYAVALTEVAANTGRYRGNFPTGIAVAGRYNVSIYQRVGGSPAVTDTYAGSGDVEWKGAAELSQAADINVTVGSTNTIAAKLQFDGSNYVKSNAQVIPSVTVGSISVGVVAPNGFLGGSTSNTPLVNIANVILKNGNPIAANAAGLVQLDLTQSVPLTNTAQTVGDALNAARAAGFGGLVLNQSGATLQMLGPDGTTVVRQFTLDSGTNPLRRS